MWNKLLIKLFGRNTQECLMDRSIFDVCFLSKIDPSSVLKTAEEATLSLGLKHAYESKRLSQSEMLGHKF